MSIKKKYLIMALTVFFCSVYPCFNAFALAFPNNDCVSYTEYECYFVNSNGDTVDSEFETSEPTVLALVQSGSYQYLYFISNQPFTLRETNLFNQKENHYANSPDTINGDYYYMKSISAKELRNYDKYLIFSDIQTACRYIKFGPNTLSQDDLDKLFNLPTPQAVYGDLFTLNNFKADFIKSNSTGQERINFSYSIPADLLNYINDGHDVRLHISWRFTFSASGAYINILNSIGASPDFVVLGQEVRTLRPNGKTEQNFYIYDDLICTNSWADNVNGGSEFWFNVINGKPLGILSNLNINGIGSDSIVATDISKLDIDFELVEMNGNQYGSIYKSSYNLVSGSNYSYVSSPDSQGNYTDSNIINNGYLDINESSSPNGVPSYEQTYHKPDGSSYVTDGSVDSNGNYNPVNVTVEGSSVNFPSNITITDGDPPVTIEDDDLTPDGIIEAIKDGYGLIDQTDTPEDDDGIISLIGKIFDNIDPSLIIMIKYGMGTVVTVAIIRAILKR